MNRAPAKTPAAMGYTFPPEWVPHQASWFSWPRPEQVAFPSKYHTVPENLAAVFRHIAPRERVEILVPNANYERIVKEQLRQHGCPLANIFFHYIRTDDCWCRDHGPAFIACPGGSNRKHRLAVVDWKFNAWGGKYPSYLDDDAVPASIAAELGVPIFTPGIVMEGGAVDFNGAGTILTTESCLLNPNRNPQLSKPRIERYLRDFYGQTKVCWLTGGIAGDDTDGHVDDVARFINPTTIVAAVEDDPRDINYRILRENRRRMDALRDQDGHPFQIVDLPMPGVVEYAGRRLPATYANFYFINGALLVPTYRNQHADCLALEILQRLVGKRKVIGIDCVELIWGRGAIHCLSQQQPIAAEPR